jgi:hypothetical protein
MSNPLKQVVVKKRVFRKAEVKVHLASVTTAAGCILICINLVKPKKTGGWKTGIAALSRKT